MSRDGWLPPGVSHEDVERAAGAWDEEEVYCCACPCPCCAPVEDEDTRCPMCEEGCGPMGLVVIDSQEEALLALREAIATGLNAFADAPCVSVPWGSDGRSALRTAAEKVRAGEWG